MQEKSVRRFGSAENCAYFLVDSFRKSKPEAEKRRNEVLDTSSSGDDRLSAAFGIDKSLTLTPRVLSLDASDPRVEESYALPQKMLRFLYEDEEPKPTNFRLSSDFRCKAASLCRPGADVSAAFSMHSTVDSKNNLEQASPGGLEAEMSKLRLTPKPESPMRHTFPPSGPRLGREAGSLSFTLPALSSLATPLLTRTTPGPEPANARPRNANHKNCRVNSMDYVIDPTSIEALQLTTLYIANIPNKYTKQMLLRLIDERFAGTYDFFYLPIDFENKCNVGYAFVNFRGLEAVRSFFHFFHRRKWPRFNSSKICEIRYAKIQGRENCVKHFANSCLMKQSDENLKPFVCLAAAK